MKQEIINFDYEMPLASLQRLPSETQDELDTLLPSVLDKAFKGKL
jgi:hypothetical protein